MSTGGSPCGACKFLRRKCVVDCVFAPYFDSEEGTARFTAVHKIFGASNTSKLLSNIPVNRRLDAVFTLCYEALARVNDPVYGCVAHIFALQNEVMNLQTELAIVQNQLSIMQRVFPQTNTSTEAASSSNAPLFTFVDDYNNNNNDCTMSKQEQHQQQQRQEDHTESVKFTTLLGLEDHVDKDGDLNAFTREFLSKYLTGSKSRPSTPI